MQSDSKTHGEGQALALREGEAFFHRSAGALGCHTRIRAGFPRDVERYMKHPHTNCVGGIRGGTHQKQHEAKRVRISLKGQKIYSETPP